MKKKQGFAVLSEEKRRAIASMGGIASQKSGKAYRMTSAEAKKNGKLSVIARMKNKQKKVS